MLSRRALVGKLAVGAAGAAVALTASTGRNKALARTTRPDPNGAPGETPAAGASVAADAVPMENVVTPQIVDAGAEAAVSAPPPWELLRPLTVNAEVAPGWRVAELSPVVDGACVLTLCNARGRSHRVHLCRNDGQPRGVVYTKQLDLMVMNGGQGDLATEEGLAQAVAEVAHVLAANEQRPPQREVVAQLLPHAERVRRFAGLTERKLR